MSYPKIKPCPNCGNAELDMFGYGEWGPPTWHVECVECNYMGPGDNKLMAIRRHNEHCAAQAQPEAHP